MTDQSSIFTASSLGREAVHAWFVENGLKRHASVGELATGCGMKADEVRTILREMTAAGEAEEVPGLWVGDHARYKLV